ncbi:MAG: sodium:solute symporter family transporter [Acidobacteriota bacterium]
MIHLPLADDITLALYLLLMAVLGSAFYRKRSTARDFFLGGRSMGWLPVGISIVAADLSAISVMGSPAWVFRNNLTLIWVTVGYPLMAPIVLMVFVPLYSRLNLYTAYEFLEQRFSLSVRRVASGLFQLLRGWHVAVALYGPALVIHLITRMTIAECVVVMGLFATIYTALGGIKAVVWTAVVQFVTVMAGILLIFAVALHGVPGGLHAVWTVNQEAGRLRLFDFSLKASDVTSFWACLLGGAFLSLGPLTTDQVVLQRLFSSKSRRDFRQSVLLQATLIVPVIAMLNAIGLVLFAYYHAHPARLAPLHNLDAVVPFFVLTELPAGLAGLVVAAIFAASMSVMSAGISALTTAFTVDFYARSIRPRASSEHYASVGRIGTVAWGGIVTVLALFAGRAGDLAIAYSRVSSAIVGPMLGIFLLGVGSRRAHGRGVLIGATVGALSVLTMMLATDWSFFYFGGIGTFATWITGYCASRIVRAPEQEGDAWMVLDSQSASRMQD